MNKIKIAITVLVVALIVAVAMLISARNKINNLEEEVVQLEARIEQYEELTAASDVWLIKARAFNQELWNIFDALENYGMIGLPPRLPAFEKVSEEYQESVEVWKELREEL